MSFSLFPFSIFGQLGLLFRPIANLFRQFFDFLRAFQHRKIQHRVGIAVIHFIFQFRGHRIQALHLQSDLQLILLIDALLPLSTVAGGPFNRSRAFRSDGALGDGRGWGVARCHASMAVGVAMQIPVTSTTPLNWFQSELFMDPPTQR